MSFQWIIDSAASISIDNRHMIGRTQTRSGVVRVVSRGPQPLKFTVTPPSGPRWSDISSDIAGAEALDRYQSSTISIPYARFPWFYNNVQPLEDLAYTVLCLEFPAWTIFARDQVSWAGAFVFQEVVADGN